MRVTTTVFQWIVRVAGVIIIILGLTIWTGSADVLIPIHMLLGITIVLALWALAILAAISRVNIGLVVLAFVWGLIVPILGVTQTSILPASNIHWVIQIVHLLVGIGALALAENLARLAKASQKNRLTARQTA